MATSISQAIVLHLAYGGQGLILEGDAQWQAEGEMVRSEEGELPSQVFKITYTQ